MARVSSASIARRLRGLSWRDRALLLEAAAWLAVARAAVVALPFPTIARRLGAHMGESPLDAGATPPSLRRITWALGAVAARTPWRSKCLEQALAAKAMLRRRGVPNTLYLGVGRGEGSGAGIEAHAWLRSGRVHVTGGSQVGRYAIVATFADAPDRSA